MGPIVATLLFYFDTEVSPPRLYGNTYFDASFAQRAYANIVRIHDEYGMHSVFRPGFPGLLEAIYIQERLVERIMPAVYRSFVSSNSETCWLNPVESALFAAKEPDFLHFLRDQMVHHFICQLFPFPNAAPHLGRLFFRRPRRHNSCRRSNHLGS